MDLFKRIQDLSAIYDDDGPSATVLESRIGFDKGGMAKLVSYVEGLPKGSTVTLQMVQDYVKKNNLNVNIKNFFDRNAKTIKNKTFISDTRLKDLKLTSEEKANIEKYGQEKYDKLKNKYSKLRVRKGQDVGSLAPEKQQKVKFKKEYNKGIKYYKSKGVEPNMDTIRKNVASNDGKFKPGNVKLFDEPGLSGLFKKYEKTDLITDLKKGKTPFEVAIEYFDKNEKEVLKTLEGKTAYSRPLGRLSGDLINAIKQDKEATKLYNKIKKTNSFNKLKNRSAYKKAVETLIPFAQEQGLIPNVNLKGKKINTAGDYFNYAYKVKRDPIAKLFGFYERVGIEHPGGVARALIFDDPATLNEIVATMPDTNLASGSTYDTYATGQARFFEKTKDPKYIKKINKIILNKQKEYGKPRTILDVDGDNVTRRTTKFSLTDPNLIEDSKSFINEYVAAGGSQRKNFNKLDPSLQKSILAFEEGDKIKGNKFLKIALKNTGAEEDFNKTMKKVMVFCPAGTAKVTTKAGGGRVPYADGPVCTPDEAIRGMNEEFDKIKKGNATAGEASRTVNKFKNLGVKGMSGLLKAGLVSEVAFEAALGFDRVISEGQSPMQAFRQSYLTAPLRAIGAMKSFEEGEREEILDAARDKGKVGRVLDLQNLVGDKNKLASNIQGLKSNVEDLQRLDDGDFGYMGGTQGQEDALASAQANLQDMYRSGELSKAEQLFSTKPQDLKLKDKTLMDAYNDAIEKRRNIQAEKGSIAQSIAADENRIRKADNTMQNLYTQYSDKQLMDMLSNSKPLQEAEISPQEYLNMIAGTKRITPAVTSTMGGLDRLRTNLQEGEALARFADNFREEKAGGGISGLSGGDPKGAMTRSMNPDSQGLSYLFNRVKKV
jgi:hypothetical protein